jgi:hypothetical protein
MAGILARWNLSPALCKPLQHATSPYAEIAALTEPLRSKVEWLRVAEFFGQLALGQFEPWDEVDIPPSETISRLRIEAPASTVDEIRTELTAAFSTSTGSSVPRESRSAKQSETESWIRYFKLSVDCRDLLAILLQTMNLKMDRISRDAACQLGPSLINCIDVSPERLEWFLDDAAPDSKRVLVGNALLASHSRSWSPMVHLPCSFHLFSAAVQVASSA